MYCPNCAEKNRLSQRFCRACGLNLERTAESLADQKRPNGSRNSLRQGEKILQNIGSLVFGGLGGLAIAGVIYLIYQIFVKMVLSGQGPLVTGGILLMAFFIFASLALVFVIVNEVNKEKKKNASAVFEDDELPYTVNTGKLLDPAASQFVPSVTEHSTELFYSPSRTRKFNR